MRYVGIRNPRAEHNPLRSLPLYRVVPTLFGPSETDKLVAELQSELWVVAAHARNFEKARKALGAANTHSIAWRRLSQRDAMAALNVARGVMRRNARRIVELETKLLAMAVPADRWAQAAASAARA